MRSSTIVLLPLAILVLAAGPIVAEPCSVLMNGIPYGSMQEAVAAFPDRESNTLVVQGVCVGKTMIEDQFRLTIEGRDGAVLDQEPAGEPHPQTLSLRQCDNASIRNLTIRGRSGSGAVSVWTSRRVDFDGVTIEGAGGVEGGLWVVESTDVFLRNVTIQDNGNGIRMDRSSVRIQGSWLPGETGTSRLQNNFTGARVNGGTLSVRGDTVIANNRIGIAGGGGEVRFCCAEDTHFPRIEDNAIYGINLHGGDLRIGSPITIRNSGSLGINMIGTHAQLGNVTVRENGTGGISSSSGFLEVVRGDISDNGRVGTNGGVGIRLINGATGRLLFNRITGNDGEGVDIQALSVAFAFENEIRGNGGFDLRCSPESYASGTKEMIGRLQCPRFAQAPDPEPGETP